MGDLLPDGTEVYPGDWVQVWAQVAESPHHPDDIPVQLESHGEQYVGHVREDWVTKPEKSPEFARRCSALYLPSGAPERLIRCEKHEGHFAAHQKDAQIWTEEGTFGYVEER